MADTHINPGWARPELGAESFSVSCMGQEFKYLGQHLWPSRYMRTGVEEEVELHPTHFDMGCRCPKLWLLHDACLKFDSFAETKMFYEKYK